MSTTRPRSARLTFKLPPPPGANLLLEISFANPVTALVIQDYNGVAIPNTPIQG